jgi:hypothetical protein
MVSISTAANQSLLWDFLDSYLLALEEARW